MNSLKQIKDFYSHKRRPLINIILDGYGIGRQDHTDAIFQAKTPFMDYLRTNFPNTLLATHGKHVGLPSDDSLGGSEVGHLTIGAGRVIQQGSTRINNMIEDGSFYESPAIQKLYENAAANSLHLLGLLSDGNVHSHIDHFIAVIRGAQKFGVKKCYLHVLLDGRDVGIQTAHIYIEKIEKILAEINEADPIFDYRIVSGGGREQITMDRDQNWSRMELGWDCHVRGQSKHQFHSASAAIQFFREKNPGLVDQDCPPFNLLDRENKATTIQDNDSLAFLNFRGDRAIQFSKLIEVKDFKPFPISKKPEVVFAGLMVYDEDEDLPKSRIIDSPKVENAFGERLVNLGLKQFRLAETQKYAHVTFFFNGGYKNPLDASKEKYQLIDSDKIDSFDIKPKMKANEIAESAKEMIEAGDFDFGLINFANADMVGHSGNFSAAIIATEEVDAALKKVCDAVKKVNGIAVITADHGNADEMLIFNKKKQQEEKSTKHSLNLVPYVLYDPLLETPLELVQGGNGMTPNLSMIAPTNFVLMGIEPPQDFNTSLFIL